MNCLNGEMYLREAIDSVYAQTYSDWEIVFWDNASTDSSGEIARSYDAKLRYFRSESTVPLGKARNLAVAEARGEYIAFLDCDDVWLPGKLAMQVERFERDPACALVYTEAYRIRKDGDRFGKFSDTHPIVKGVIDLPSFIDGCVVSPFSSIMVRKDLFDQIKGFREDFNIAEEYDFYIRLAEKGEIGYVDSHLTEYRHHADNLTWRRDQTIPEVLRILDELLLSHPHLRLQYPERIAKRYCFLHFRLAAYHLRKMRPFETTKHIWQGLSRCNWNAILVWDMLMHDVLMRWLKGNVRSAFKSSSYQPGPS